MIEGGAGTTKSPPLARDGDGLVVAVNWCGIFNFNRLFYLARNIYTNTTPAHADRGGLWWWPVPSLPLLIGIGFFIPSTFDRDGTMPANSDLFWII